MKNFRKSKLITLIPWNSLNIELFNDTLVVKIERKLFPEYWNRYPFYCTQFFLEHLLYVNILINIFWYYISFITNGFAYYRNTYSIIYPIVDGKDILNKFSIYKFQSLHEKCRKNSWYMTTFLLFIQIKYIIFFIFIY